MFKLKGISKAIILSSLFISVAEAQEPPNDGAWHFEVAPYIWGLSMDGTIQVGTVRAHVDQDFNDILKKLNFAGMIWLDAYKDNLDLFLNLLYASLSDSSKDGPLNVNAYNKFALYSAGASYKIFAKNAFSLEPYVGVRYTVNNTTVKLNVPTILNVRAVDNKDWADPIVGLKLKYAFNRAWSGVLSGDIGGTNASSDYSYNLVGLVGYSPQTTLTNTTVYLGYRLLDQHYITGSGAKYYNWNMKIFGPLLGIAIKF